MRKFDSIHEVDTLTDEEAREIVQLSCDLLKRVTAAEQSAISLDDGGDYLAAAIDNYHYLFHAYWDNDGEPTSFLASVKAWLKSTEWGGSDGELRYDLFTERWQEEEWGWNEAVQKYWAATHPEESEQIRTNNLPLTRETETEATNQWKADMEAIEGKQWEDWPNDVQIRVGAYKK